MGKRQSGQEETEFWKLVVESYQKSGMTVQQFCQQEGLSASSFYNWRKKLSTDNDDSNIEESSGRSAFMEIGEIPCSPSALKITFPAGICIHAESSCNIELFREAIKILNSSSC